MSLFLFLRLGSPVLPALLVRRNLSHPQSEKFCRASLVLKQTRGILHDTFHSRQEYDLNLKLEISFVGLEVPLPRLLSLLLYELFQCLNNITVDSSGCAIFNRLKTGINWNRRVEFHSRHGYMSAFMCVVLSCIGNGLAIGRSPIQGVIPRCLDKFVVPEINSESE